MVIDKGHFSADHYIMALGAYTVHLARKLGMRIPVYPVKGYSITLPITDTLRAPVSTVMDETYKVAITRLGDRIRVGGMAELTGFDLSRPDRRSATLLRSLNTLFPQTHRLDDLNLWSGLRPMTPDGTPIVGRTPIRNVSLNTGHGALGWTMACGSGKLIADLISGDQPEIPCDDLNLCRYQRQRR